MSLPFIHQQNCPAQTDSHIYLRFDVFSFCFLKPLARNVLPDPLVGNLRPRRPNNVLSVALEHMRRLMVPFVFLVQVRCFYPSLPSCSISLHSSSSWTQLIRVLAYTAMTHLLSCVLFGVPFSLHLHLFPANKDSPASSDNIDACQCAKGYQGPAGPHPPPPSLHSPSPCPLQQRKRARTHTHRQVIHFFIYHLRVRTRCCSCSGFHYFSSGSGPCLQCDAGTYKTDTGPENCVECAPGKYSTGADTQEYRHARTHAFARQISVVTQRHTLTPKDWLSIFASARIYMLTCTRIMSRHWCNKWRCVPVVFAERILCCRQSRQHQLHMQCWLFGARRWKLHSMCTGQV